MKRMMIAAGLSGILLMTGVASPSLADAGDAQISPQPTMTSPRPVMTSPQVVTDHSSSLGRRQNAVILLVILALVAVIAAN